jgi:hypothetical protein
MLYFEGKIVDTKAETSLLNKRYMIIPADDRSELEIYVDGEHVDTISLDDYIIARKSEIYVSRQSRKREVADGGASA